MGLQMRVNLGSGGRSQEMTGGRRRGVHCCKHVWHLGGVQCQWRAFGFICLDCGVQLQLNVVLLHGEVGPDSRVVAVAQLSKWATLGGIPDKLN